MKKTALLILFVLMVGCWAMAQTGTITGNIAYIPTTDVMGAHENGGRGCAGCHAPHGGGRGSGGNISGKTGAANAYGAGANGDYGLWGTDTTAIQAAGTITFDANGARGKGYSFNLAGYTWSSGAIYTGLATCLSCHDGNFSQGAMMSGIAYEQAWGLLNFAGAGLRNANGPQAANGPGGYPGYGYAGQGNLNPYPNVNPYVNTTTTGQPMLYGTQPIPTLLGNNGAGMGDYNNDHPVGPFANLGAVMGNNVTGWLSNLTVTFSGTNNTSVQVVAKTGTPFYNFAWTYGLTALNNTVGATDNNPMNAYVVCTTCHDQHVQNVFNAAAPYGGIAGCPTGAPCASLATVAKIFYMKGAYNPAAPYDPTHEPSTMRFCQQCHFQMSSESYGATNIGTAY